jgi:hypothetical protein
VISNRRNGDRLIGNTGPLAADLYAADTPPCHGTTALDPDRIAQTKIGDQLEVRRDGNKWYLTDGADRIAVLRWRPGDDGKPHAVTGQTIHLPDRGTLRVERVLVSPSGVVKDVSGTVVPHV